MDNMTLAQLQSFAAKHKSADGRLNAGEAQITDVVSRLVAPTIERLQTNESGMQDIVNRMAGPALERTNAAAKRMGRTVLKMAQNPHARSMENAAEMTGVLARLQSQGFPPSSGEQPAGNVYPPDSGMVQGEPNPRFGTSFASASTQGMGMPRAAQGPPPKRGGPGVGTATTTGVPDIAPFQYGLPPHQLPPHQPSAPTSGPAPPVQPIPPQSGQSGASGFGAIPGLPTGPPPLNPGSQYDIYCTNGQAGAVLEGSGPPTPGSVLMASGVLGSGITAAYLAVVTSQCATLSQQPPPTSGQHQCPPGQVVGVIDYTDAGQPIYGCVPQITEQPLPPVTPPTPPTPPTPGPPAKPDASSCNLCEAIMYAAELLCWCATGIAAQLATPPAQQPAIGSWEEAPDWQYEATETEDYESREQEAFAAAQQYLEEVLSKPPDKDGVLMSLQQFGAEAGGAVGGDTTALHSPGMGGNQ